MSHQTRDDVGTQSIAYSRMNIAWTVIRDLLGGTERMRSAGTTYLPKEEAEEADLYNCRVARSFLFNGLKDTIRSLSARPFAKPITFEGDMPPKTARLEMDADKLGRTLTQFAREVFKDGVAYGKSHILVDAPVKTGTPSLADEKKNDIRMRFVHIRADQLIGWRYETQTTGARRLSQIRYSEFVEVAEGKYADKVVERVRVINAPGGGKGGTWEVWERVASDDSQANHPTEASRRSSSRADSGGNEFKIVDQGAHGFEEIPLFTFYTDRLDDLEAQPPLADLADMNLAHWQSNSSQKNILNFARVGILFLRGFTKDDIDGGEEGNGIVIAPNTMVTATNPEAGMDYVEYKGQAIEAGFKDLEVLEQKMERLGLRPLTESRRGSTATGVAIDEASSHTDMQAWVTALEHVLDLAFMAAAKGNGENLPESFKTNIFSEFALGMRATEDMKTLQAMRVGGDITQETLISAAKKRGILPESLDVEAEVEATLAEIPKIPETGPFPGGEAADDEE